MDSLLSKWGDQDEDKIVDVVGNGDGERSLTPAAAISTSDPPPPPPAQKPTCMMLAEDSVGGFKFVREAAAEVGVRIGGGYKGEDEEGGGGGGDEIAPGVFYPIAEKIMFRVSIGLLSRWHRTLEERAVITSWLF